VSEVLVVSLAALAGGALPLLPLQILFLNLVTDVFPALALAFGEGDRGVLLRPPRDPAEPILTRRGWAEILVHALVISLSVLGALVLAERWLDYPREEAVTVSFLTLAAAQLWQVFNTRARGSGLLRNEVTSNPWVWGALGLCTLLLLAAVYLPGLRQLLETRRLDLAGWGLVLSMSLVPLLLGQAFLTLRKQQR
jgi:Ca2+-transporting ATPase